MSRSRGVSLHSGFGEKLASKTLVAISKKLNKKKLSTYNKSNNSASDLIDEPTPKPSSIEGGKNENDTSTKPLNNNELKVDDFPQRTRATSNISFFSIKSGLKDVVGNLMTEAHEVNNGKKNYNKLDDNQNNENINENKTDNNNNNYIKKSKNKDNIIYQNPYPYNPGAQSKQTGSDVPVPIPPMLPMDLQYLQFIDPMQLYIALQMSQIYHNRQRDNSNISYSQTTMTTTQTPSKAQSLPNYINGVYNQPHRMSVPTNFQNRHNRGSTSFYPAIPETHAIDKHITSPIIKNPDELMLQEAKYKKILENNKQITNEITENDDNTNNIITKDIEIAINNETDIDTNIEKDNTTINEDMINEKNRINNMMDAIDKEMNKGRNRLASLFSMGTMGPDDNLSKLNTKILPPPPKNIHHQHTHGHTHGHHGTGEHDDHSDISFGITQDWDNYDNKRAVGWYELFTDLIFVIIIIKMTKMFTYLWEKYPSTIDQANIISQIFVFHLAVFVVWLEMAVIQTRFKSKKYFFNLMKYLYFAGVVSMAMAFDKHKPIENSKIFSYGLLVCFITHLFIHFHLCLIPRATLYSLVNICVTFVSIVIIITGIVLNTENEKTNKLVAMICIFVSCLFLFWRTSATFEVNPNEIPVNVHHFAERFGLFMMLYVGESIISMLGNYKYYKFNKKHYYFIHLEFLSVYIIRFIYFNLAHTEARHNDSTHALRNAGSPGARSFVFAHIFLSFGLVGDAIGLKLLLKDLKYKDFPLRDATFFIICHIFVQLTILFIRHTHQNIRNSIYSYLHLFSRIILTIGSFPILLYYCKDEVIFMTLSVILTLFLAGYDVLFIKYIEFINHNNKEYTDYGKTMKTIRSTIYSPRTAQLAKHGSTFNLHNISTATLVMEPQKITNIILKDPENENENETETDKEKE